MKGLFLEQICKLSPEIKTICWLPVNQCDKQSQNLLTEKIQIQTQITKKKKHTV